MCEDNMLWDIRREDKRPSPEDGEAIVVGAVGSAAPWFLTGWAEDVEIEFMIDTGCQVTILATSVFKRMCAADPQVIGGPDCVCVDADWFRLTHPR